MRKVLEIGLAITAIFLGLNIGNALYSAVMPKKTT